MLLIDGMVFFLQDTDLIFHSLQMVAAETDSVDSWKFLSAKKPLFPQILLLLLHAHSCDAGDHR